MFSGSDLFQRFTRYAPTCVTLVIVVLAALRLPDYGYGSDPKGMLESVHTFLQTGQYQITHFPPGFGILAYPLFLLTDNIPFSGVLLNYISYLLILVLTYFLSKSVNLTSSESWFVVALVALNPGVYIESNNGMSEIAYTCLLVLTTYTVFKLLNEERWLLKTVLVGFLLSFTYLIRAEVLVVFLIISFVLLTLNFGETFIRRFVQVFIISLMVISTVVFYSSYLHSVTGDVAVTGKTHDVFFNYGGWVDREAMRIFSIDLEIHKSNKVFEYIVQNPMVFVLRMIYNLIDLIATLLMSLWYVLIPFICCVAYTLIRSKKTLKTIISDAWNVSVRHKVLITSIFMLIVLPAFSLILFYIGDRFVIPASVGGSLMLGFLAIHFLRGNNFLLSTMLVFSVLLSIWNPYDVLRAKGFGITDGFHGRVFSLSNAYADEQWSVPYKHAINWARTNMALNDYVTVAGSKKGGTMLAFLNPSKISGNNGKFIQLPTNLTEEIIVETLEKSADFVVLNKNYVKKDIFRKYLLDEQSKELNVEVCNANTGKGFIILTLLEKCK